MASKTIVTLKIAQLKSMKLRLKNTQVLREIGDSITDEIKDTIAAGLSPVRGFGRFEAYSGATDRRKYPFNVQKRYPTKRLRPVNLELSGEMLDSLRSKTDGGRLEIGIFDSEQAAKARKHQIGEGVPQRKFLPTTKGEDFIVSITRMIKDLFVKAIDDILK